MNSFRITSSSFGRQEETKPVEKADRLYVLSVEGNRTEKQYFENVEKYKRAIGIDSLIHIEVLSRRKSDGGTSPDKIISLLDEYMELKREGPVPSTCFRELAVFEDETEIENLKADIRKWDELPERRRTEIEETLKLVDFECNIGYRKHLYDLDADYGDKHCIVLDRDAHDPEVLKEMIKLVHEKGYGCYLSNPCFELWLLMHSADIDFKKFEEKMSCAESDGKLCQKKCSETFHHGKKIGRNTFEKTI